MDQMWGLARLFRIVSYPLATFVLRMWNFMPIYF
jgi:hypothetical protein